ncbi:MAG: hypothetical protein ACRD26_18445 [Vicinamibacterales bacterium]
MKLRLHVGGLGGNTSRRWGASVAGAGAAAACAVALVHAQITIHEINPTRSTLDASDPDGASGGRVNGLGRASNTTFYAASEWGGVYKSTDAGRRWARLDAHLPTAMWDVEVNPADANRVIATSFFDGRVKSLAGINISADGGATWTPPPSAAPPEGFCRTADRRDEPSAFGIAFDPANARNVYVGTSCGLAISHDAGTTWRFVDPTPANGANDVWDVVVHHGGIIDVCGDDGHRRSTDGGASWTTAVAGGSPLPAGLCSIAASPDEAHVLFAVAGGLIFETDDGGGTWNTQFVNPSPQGRIPFVVVNDRPGRGFDLWFGDVSLHRASCTTPPTAAVGGTARCPASTQWAGGFTRSAGAHDDTGDLVFSQPSSPSVAACPVLMSSDGGVYFNLRASPQCHTPLWEQPNVTPRALWLFGMGGADAPGAAGEELYFGNQDNGTFATDTAGAVTPTWSNRDCCDGFDIAGTTNQVVYTMCCFGGGRANQVFLRGTNMAGGAQIGSYPPGNVPGFTFVDVLDRFGPDSYVLITSAPTPSGGIARRVSITTDITAGSVEWTALGLATVPRNACGIRAAGTATSPTFYAQAGVCSGSSADRLFRFTGTASNGTWQPVNPPAAAGAGAGFGIFGVDRANGNRLFASVMTPAGARMFRSANAGATWTADTALDALMTGGGLYRARTRRGPTNFTAFDGYVQPTLAAFDPADPQTLLAASRDAGIFLTRNGGTTWTPVTDNTGPPANPVIPRPHFAYFDRECGESHAYVGTQGRGVWRVKYASRDPMAENACTSGCETKQNACVAAAGKPGSLSKAQCVERFKTCAAGCSCPV